jgi:hypothetical protein
MAARAVVALVIASSAACAAGDARPARAPLACVGGIAILETGWACAIRPSSTGRGISDAFGLHVVAFPGTVTPATRVYVHLVGTGGMPAGPAGDLTNGHVLAEATRAGYLVINLAYDNVTPLRRLCGHDLDCYEPLRWEIIHGEDPPPPWRDRKRVTPPDDIDSRLGALVDTLVASGRDLPPALRPLDWSRLRVGGHSQGGGHAGVIARRRAVARVCMLAAPADASPADQPARWLAEPWATPLERRRVVVHRDDGLFSAIAPAAAAMGMTPGAGLRVLDEPTVNPHGYPVAVGGGLAWACLQ